jgi:ribosome-binding factor A
MEYRKPLRKDVLSSCAETRPDDGVDPRTYFRKPSHQRTNRKALQLCQQIAQTLGQVIGWESGDELLAGLTVLSAEPAPDSRRVLVTVCAPPAGGDPDRRDASNEILERLARAAGRLRTEVAGAIHRKRVPELVFRVVGPEEVQP